MNAFRALGSYCKVELLSASPLDMLRAIIDSEIQLYDLIFISELCVHAWVKKEDYIKLQECVLNRGEEIVLIARKGLYWELERMRKRPVLLTGIALLLIGLFLLPTKVLFVQVEGSISVPEKLIIERAQECGIGFLSSRREVRSERMKNSLLSAIPDLEWAGVNTRGCVAVISVKERATVSQHQENHDISNVVASRDGIVQQITVLKGNALCQTGQAVKKGQVLISGYEDRGICLRGGPAEGEIRAETLRRLRVVTPANYTNRGEITDTDKKYSLRIGKKLIKLYKDSGISHTGCVKMYSERYLSLPGGFSLPVAMIVETVSDCNCKGASLSESADTGWLESAAESYILNSAAAGQILKSRTALSRNAELLCLDGEYLCSEMIGQVRNEGIVLTDEQ